MQETKDVLSFVFSIIEAGEKGMADGKLDWADLGLAPAIMMSLVPAIQGANKVPAEIKAMSEEDKAELLAWAREEFDLQDDQVEADYERAIQVVLLIVSILKSRKAI